MVTINQLQSSLQYAINQNEKLRWSGRLQELVAYETSEHWGLNFETLKWTCNNYNVHSTYQQKLFVT